MRGPVSAAGEKRACATGTTRRLGGLTIQNWTTLNAGWPTPCSAHGRRAMTDHDKETLEALATALCERLGGEGAEP